MFTSTVTDSLIACLVVVLGGLLIWLGLSLMEANDKIDGLVADLAVANARAAKSDEAVQQTLIDVAPLLEKTDWMTGRWHGQFQTLVSMEQTRNQVAETVRRRLMNAPALQDYWRANGTKILADAGTQGLKGINS